MRRIEALEIVSRVFEARPLIVTCGATSRELAHLGRRDSHLYLLDSMGVAAATGVGLALAGVGPVAAIEGDGSLLMGLSVVATIAHSKPAGFTLIVLDNHEHASAARIPTQAATVDLAQICRGAALTTVEVAGASDLEEALNDALASPRPTVVIARIDGGNEPGVQWLLDDPAEISARFQRSLTASR